MQIGDIEMRWLGHSGFVIKNKKVIYIDPYSISGFEKFGKADIILITHSHYDHCSIADIQKIVKDGTVIVLPADVQSKVTKLNARIQMQVVEPGDTMDLGEVRVMAVPAYNKDKKFHPKGENWLGFVVKINNVTIYHAGDTDCIAEMQRLTGHGKREHEFIALLPVGGTYTMNTDEAAKAVSIIKPTLAIPIHWGSIVGNREDAERFCELCKEQGMKAEILERE